MEIEPFAVLIRVNKNIALIIHLRCNWNKKYIILMAIW